MAAIAIFTLGCKVNQAESEELKSDLQGRGHDIVNDPGVADLCVVNTCTVTAESDRKCRKLIRWLSRRGAGDIVAAGCYAEVNPHDLEVFMERIGDKAFVRQIVQIMIPDRYAISTDKKFSPDSYRYRIHSLIEDISRRV